MALQLVKILGSPISLGIDLTAKGVYAAGTTYVAGDSVSYNGSSFVAIQETTGNLPTDTTYWQVLANKGDTGATGPTGPTGPAGADGADGVVQTIVAGTNVTIDSTDPANPIVNASGGGGGLNVGLAIAVQNGIINL